MAQNDSKARLLDATLHLVRAKGYAATRIEDVCAEAGLTKGSFFHHFKSKDDLARAAAAHWDAHTTGFFAEAPYHAGEGPLERLLGYVDFRRSILTGDLTEFTCFGGNIVQEAWRSHPEISGPLADNIVTHGKTLQADIEAAMAQYGVKGDWTAESLALHIQAVVQGGFIMAKATGGAAAAAQSLDHLRRYLELTFSGTKPS